MVKLFVGGFPLDMEEIDLVKMVMPFGQVSTIKIVRDKKTRICKGYAFLEMQDREAAEEAIKNLNGHPIGDRTLSLSIREEKEAAQGQPLSPATRVDPMVKYTRVERSSDPIKKKRPRK
jgi:RNA recognition motif-containing protein